jgi:hypothetical protein
MENYFTIENVAQAYDHARATQEEIEIFAKCEYLGYNDEMCPAKACLVVDITGESYIKYYEFFDGETWKDTEERSGWTEQEINDTFFPHVL